MPWFAGVPRNEIDWGPTIDANKCVGCGVCLNCGRSVFEWKDGKSVVVRRGDCVVGCSTCGNLCQGRCISFPPLGDLRRFYKENQVWKYVKEAMIAEGRISEPELKLGEVDKR